MPTGVLETIQFPQLFRKLKLMSIVLTEHMEILIVGLFMVIRHYTTIKRDKL